jgi:hypothetical protein
MQPAELDAQVIEVGEGADKGDRKGPEYDEDDR